MAKKTIAKEAVANKAMAEKAIVRKAVAKKIVARKVAKGGLLDVTQRRPRQLYVLRMDSTDTPRLSTTSIGAPPPWMRMMELRAIGERASMSFAAPLRRLLPRGDGHHVIVLPGFGANDRSTRPLRLLLRDLGYHSHGWRLGDNVGPTPQILAGLYGLLARIHGDPPPRCRSSVGVSAGSMPVSSHGRRQTTSAK